MKRFVNELSTSGGHRLRRLAKLQSLLQHQLGDLLARELELPQGVLLTVNSIEIIPDLSLAKVGVSVIPYLKSQPAFAILQKLAPTLQYLVNQRLKTYRVPKLEFYLDDTPERADQIEHILDSLKKEE